MARTNTLIRSDTGGAPRSSGASFPSRPIGNKTIGGKTRPGGKGSLGLGLGKSSKARRHR